MSGKEVNKGGRPTVMTLQMREEICRRLAEGESLRSIARSDGMPSVSTVTLAVVQDREGFSAQYAQAREAAGYAHGDRIADVVELLSTGAIDPNVGKAMMDGLKWVAERMAPKSHSAKQEIAHTSPDGSFAPTTIRIVAAGEPGKESA